jgi:hypothetical protein
MYLLFDFDNALCHIPSSLYAALVRSTTYFWKHKPHKCKISCLVQKSPSGGKNLRFQNVKIQNNTCPTIKEECMFSNAKSLTNISASLTSSRGKIVEGILWICRDFYAFAIDSKTT